MKGRCTIIDSAIKEGRGFLLEPEAKSLCSSYGIPTTRFKVARDVQDALSCAHEIGYPVVLKVISPDILHKTDVGGVILDVKNDEELKKAYERILDNVHKNKPTAKIVGILIEECLPPATEVIVGVTRDPQFGHVMMFGLGGVFVEILKDVSFRVLPITRSDALDMIKEIKGYPLLKGYRGKEAADIEAIVDILLKTSRMISENPRIKEMDLNPIRVYAKGAKVVDARVILDIK